ncbi:NYN domain-containing protein [Paenibacillus ginsengarvi]|uniref:NYN domain-containing protein n=1 Tax=Paenibacillus ginsengarvi TaxID=400777 RepID=A0A3B0AWT4_9BACL|nr:NYN domain-containing protein [Paenibacillus ginsengarvi]RKN65175.1 NYN domain-containing protein [Paenibacillus ginsengarvi]
MKQVVIVDGYNIIGAWPELNKLKDVSLEDARDRLIDMLADYQAYKGNKVYLVFDAYRVPGLGGKYRQRKIEVLYTREKETADERIERLVADLRGRRVQIHVATSDSVEQHVTFGQGALRLPARELLFSINEIRKEIRVKIQETTAPAKNSLDSKLSDELREKFEKWRRGL